MKHLLLTLALVFAAVSATAQSQEPPNRWLREWSSTDFSQSLVAFSEIKSGGPPKDGIPAIDSPRFERVGVLQSSPAANAPVMSVTIGEDARAYPLSILLWHEIVNDTVDGRPVAVTYCPLCNSGVVFDRRIDGQTTTFGTTGKLRYSDLVMYDRATESWWQQFNGRAIVGARVGTKLEAVPSRLESFAEFAARHPDGQVLVPNDPGSRGYGRNPYAGYDSASRPFLYDGSYEGPGRPLMRVVAVDGRSEAWSLELIRERGTLRSGDLEISWQAGQASALDTARVADGRDVGTVSVERVLESGRRVPAVYHLPFAFAFAAFNPDATIHHD